MREAGSSSYPMVMILLSHYKTAVIDYLFLDVSARV